MLTHPPKHGPETALIPEAWSLSPFPETFWMNPPAAGRAYREPVVAAGAAGSMRRMPPGFASIAT